MATEQNTTTTDPEVGTAAWFAQQAARYDLQVGVTQIAKGGRMSPQARDGITAVAQDEVDRLTDAVIAAPAPNLEAVRLKARMLVENYEYTPALTVETAYRLEMIEPDLRLAASIWADLERLAAAEAPSRQQDAPCTREISSAAVHAVDGLLPLDGICAVFHMLVEGQRELDVESLAWLANQLSDIKNEITRRVNAVHDLTRDEASKAAEARIDAMIDAGRRAAA